MSERFTPERLEELRRIAEEATPGNRVVVVPEGRRGHEWFVLQADGSTVAVINRWARSMSTADYCRADAEFFAAFDPPTVLTMLDEIEKLRQGREALAAALAPAREALADLDKSYYRVERQDPGGYVMGSVSVASLVAAIEAARKALALLDSVGGEES